MKNTEKKLFISGAISSRMDTYRKDFGDFEESLRSMGFSNILSPAVLPSTGFEHSDYMRICLAMLNVCDIVVFMPGWEDSDGCRREHTAAEASDKLMLYGLEEAKMCAEGLYESD